MGDLSVNGSSPTDPKKKPTVEPFVGTENEYWDVFTAGRELQHKVVGSGECASGQLPDGTAYQLCKDGIFTHKDQDGRYETHTLKYTPNGFDDHYAIQSKGLWAAGCVDQDGKKCE